MNLFGISLNRYSLPILYLACASIGFLLIREAFPIFRPSVVTRALTIIIELIFIFLTLPVLYKNPKWKLAPLPIILILSWIIFLFLSTILSNYPLQGLVRWFEIFINIIFGISFYLFINEHKELRILAIKGLMITLIFYALVYLTLWVILPSPYLFNWVTGAPFVNNIRHMGYIITTLLPLCFIFAHNNKKYDNLIFYIYSSVSWTLIFWLGGRGAFLAVTLTTLVYLIIFPKHTLKTLFTILIGILLSQLFIVQSGSLNLFRLFDISTEKSLNEYSSSRIQIYLESIKYWIQNSPIIGVGADGFHYLPNLHINNPYIIQPHSIIIQLLLSYGVYGVFIPAVLFIWLTLKQFKIKKLTFFISYLAILGACLHAVTDGVLYHAHSIFIFSILIALCIPPTIKTTTNRTNLFLFSSIIAGIFIFTFLFQVVQSKKINATDAEIAWIEKYPIYFEPHQWLENRDSKERNRLVEIALKNSSNPCRIYKLHSQPDQKVIEEICYER